MRCTVTRTRLAAHGLLSRLVSRGRNCRFVSLQPHLSLPWSVMQRILVVDDSATIRKMVKASLAPLGATEFIDAATGLEAIEQLALGGVGLIVLDLNMPDMHRT